MNITSHTWAARIAITAMLALGMTYLEMPAIEILIACCMVVAFSTGWSAAERFIAARSKREPAPTSERHNAIYFAVAIGIGCGSNYLLPNIHYLVSIGLAMFGILAGAIAAQSLAGKKQA